MWGRGGGEQDLKLSEVNGNFDRTIKPLDIVKITKTSKRFFQLSLSVL